MQKARLVPGPAATSTPLAAAGLSGSAVNAWLTSRPEPSANFKRDTAAFEKFWRLAADLRAKLPEKAARTVTETEAAAFILGSERSAREAFLAAHVEAVYRKLTNDCSSFVRVERLALDAADLVPGLVPTADALRREQRWSLKDKEGLEIDQGIFFAHVLAHENAGRHLLHAMLLPLPETAEHLAYFEKHGTLDLGHAEVSRIGKAVVVEMRSPRFLNAMDDATLGPIEVAVDVALLDPTSEVAVLRGGFVEHPKYGGRRIFSSGINLTHLYYGQIAFLFYLRHALGYEHKIFRGLAKPDASPEDAGSATLEKPWIATVDTFAIGGGCQHLLVVDYVLAASDAYLSLPARKEGIMPGAANLRLARFTGDRIARQAIMYGRRLDCDTPEGRLVCDEIAPPEKMDDALKGVIEGLTSSGVVSAVANRRGFRIGQEPLDLFRRYMALYSREQAYCHFHPTLITNLERHWNAKERKL